MVKKKVKISCATEIVFWSFLLQVIVYRNGFLPVGLLPLNKIELVFGFVLDFVFWVFLRIKTTLISYDKCSQVNVGSTSK